METNIGILAIGNEVVEGQITNRNAAWLSEQLSALGAQPLYHLSCRDNDSEIQSSLNFLSQHCHLIIVSGGLGPTKDDGTRQSLSTWLGLPLEKNDEQWQIIKAKLESRELTIREGHKNQANIPSTAVPLPNEVGVAPGFFVKGSSCFVASLPGPPNELQSMFLSSLKPMIIEELAPKKDKNLETWICLGAPESEIAHIVESILDSSLEIGYRLHKPYVEVKVWLSPSDLSTHEKSIKRMEEKLSPWLVERKILNIRMRFKEYLEKFSNVFIIDHLTSGLFLEKLKEGSWTDHLRYQCFEHKSFNFFAENQIREILKHMNMEQNQDALFISLFARSENSAFVSFNNTIKAVELPRKIPIKSKLGQLYIIENCFLNHE